MNKFFEGALSFSLGEEESEKVLLEVYWGGEEHLEDLQNYLATTKFY